MKKKRGGNNRKIKRQKITERAEHNEKIRT